MQESIKKINPGHVSRLLSITRQIKVCGASQFAAVSLVILVLCGYTINNWRFRMADDVIYIDFADGVKRVMNNTKLYVKFLAKFKNDTRLDDLESAVAAGDMEKARNAAHTLKGLAANLSLAELFKQSLALETQIKGGTADPAQLNTVKTAFEKTLQEIDKVITENG
jgi:HPt (histidine-containing phosphotransfer) domain-containing protein